MIPTLFLSTLLVLSGQSPFKQAPRTQPNALSSASRSEAVSDNERKVVSPQSRAEAKRLYKEGVKYGRSGLPKQAAEIFEKALKFDPYYVDVYYGLGIAYFDLGQYEKAAESLRALIKLNSGDWQARDFLARVELEIDKNRKREAAQPTESPKPIPESDSGATRKPEQLANDTEPVKPQIQQNTVDNPTTKTDPPAAVAESTQRETPIASPDSPKPETQVNSPTAELASAPAANSNSIEKPEEKPSLTNIYRVGAGDVLDVRLTDSPTNKSTLFTITPSGLLEHPSIPDPIPVAGMTVEEIAAELKADLKRRALMDDAKVWVGVRDYGSHAILVSGLVKEPGTKILRREALPLYVVIADAQPLPEAGRVTLVRNQTNEFISIELSDIKEMSRLVLPGDVITFHPYLKQFFYVSGAVVSPGEKTFRRGLTLTQALMAAGGVTARAKEARVGRDRGDGHLVVVSYKLKDINSGKLRDPIIEPGDRITIVD